MERRCLPQAYFLACFVGSADVPGEANGILSPGLDKSGGRV